jgi:hypothetical protein
MGVFRPETQSGDEYRQRQLTLQTKMSLGRRCEMNRIAALFDFGFRNTDLRRRRGRSFQSEIRIPQLNAGLSHVKVVLDWNNPYA